MFLAIIFITVLSIGQILQYYFSYEDFSLLYGVQFPNDKNSIFLYPGFVAYRFLRYILIPQFHLFGYQPFGYYFISLLLFLLVIFLLFKFLQLLIPKYKNLAFFTTLIISSGYVGIEALTWNVAGGQIHLALLVAVEITLIYTVLYFRYKKILDFLILIFAFFVSVYFFQFRSYLLFLWVPFLIFFQKLENGEKLSFKLLGGVVILMAPLILFFFQSIKFIVGRIEHVDLSLGPLLHVFLQNLGNLLFPSELLNAFSNSSLPGILALILFSFPPIYMILKKHKLGFIAAFFSLSTVISLLTIMIVTAFIGQIPTVWPSSHRFYIILLPFISGYLAIVLSVLRSRIQIPILLLILVTHIFFSNKVISDRFENLSMHLRYFYTGVTKVVPHIDKHSVFLVTLSRPYPPGPFVSGSDAGSGHYLAGFYKTRFSDFLFATTPDEAVKLLVNNKLTANDIYAFDYKRGDLLDETKKVRDILSNGRNFDLGTNFRGREIEFPNLGISAAAPIFIKLNISATLADQHKIDVPIIGGDMSIDQYFKLFFSQVEERAKMTVSSTGKSLGEEHGLDKVIDGRYDTTWIPQEWNNDGVSITINLGYLRKISQVVWASSRSAPWDFRQPSEYEVSISGDGENFMKVASKVNIPQLLTGQFFTDQFNAHDAKYIRLTIKKTRGGWTPAVDEVEVFEKPIEQKDLENYFLIKNNPALYFPNDTVKLYYFRQVLKQKIPVEINWKIDNDADYLSGQEKQFNIEGLNIDKEYVVVIPKTGRIIKSIRVRSVDFPSELEISKFKVWQPSLEEFSANKELLKIE